MCTDVAARGLDIPNVQNVIHYQCPFNAEVYVHRSGRTARIGKSGEALALLAAEDEKNFKTICSVIHKGANPMESIQMLSVKYANLELMRSVVDTAKELEAKEHRQHADEKSASWVLKTARSAGLTLDDDLKYEV